jgi:hypothetical protein
LLKSSQVVTGQGSADDSAFYSEGEPVDEAAMVDMGPVGTQGLTYDSEGNALLRSMLPGESKCALWIIDISGTRRQLSLNIPKDRYSRVEVATCASGSLIFYERYPGGDVMSYDMGRVSSNRKYWRWFHADTIGTHTIWFTVGGKKSNSVTFNVLRSGGPTPPITDSCAVWTDKMQYGIGETANIFYRVNMPCSVTLTINKPYQPPVVYGPRYVYAGTYSVPGSIYYPLGMRTVTLQTSGGLYCTKSTNFNVVTLPLFASDGSGINSVGGPLDAGNMGMDGQGESGPIDGSGFIS